jgi:hypothetical protein
MAAFGCSPRRPLEEGATTMIRVRTPMTQGRGPVAVDRRVNGPFGKFVKEPAVRRAHGIADDILARGVSNHAADFVRCSRLVNLQVQGGGTRNVRSRHRDHSALRAISGSTFVALRAG